MPCALRIGLDGVVWAEMCVVVPLGLYRGCLVGVWRRCAVGIGGRRVVSMRCAVGIGGDNVVWVALCPCDWQGGRCVGGGVPLGLVGRASWVALWRWDRLGGRRVGSAVALGVQSAA